MTASQIARQLHGRRSGKRWSCRCPVPRHQHGDRNRSLSVWESSMDGIMGLSGLQAHPNAMEVAPVTTPSTDYRLIPLTQGKFAKVDAADYDLLMQWKWYALWDSKMQSFYAVRNGKRIGPRYLNAREPQIRMHRTVLKLDMNCRFPVDHENHDTLDNRKSNLRLAGAAQNQMNARRRRDNTSGFKGVNWVERDKSWVARISHKGKRIPLGYYKTPEEAYAAYCSAAHIHYGEFARLS